MHVSLWPRGLESRQLEKQSHAARSPAAWHRRLCAGHAALKHGCEQKNEPGVLAATHCGHSSVSSPAALHPRHALVAAAVACCRHTRPAHVVSARAGERLCIYTLTPRKSGHTPHRSRAILCRPAPNPNRPIRDYESLHTTRCVRTQLDVTR
jgi:hypothetical protein